MPQEVFRQNNFAGGELDPDAHARTDVRIYGQSLAIAENLAPAIQGPARRRPGLSHVDVVRTQLAAVDLSAATITAPNGGAAAGVAAGGGVTTATAMGTGDYVVLAFDFGGPVTVSMCDILDYAVVEGGGGGGDWIQPPVAPPRPGGVWSGGDLP